MLKRRFKRGDSNRKLVPTNKQNVGILDNLTSEVLNTYKKLKSLLANVMRSTVTKPAPIESKKTLAPNVDSRSNESPNPAKIAVILREVNFLSSISIAEDHGNLI